MSGIQMVKSRDILEHKQAFFQSGFQTTIQIFENRTQIYH